jgi:hypothetical protein
MDDPRAEITLTSCLQHIRLSAVLDLVVDGGRSS